MTLGPDATHAMGVIRSAKDLRLDLESTEDDQWLFDLDHIGLNNEKILTEGQAEFSLTLPGLGLP